jgi:ComF family protein
MKFTASAEAIVDRRTWPGPMAASAAPNRRLRRQVLAALEALRAAVFPARCLHCRRLLPAAGGAFGEPVPVAVDGDLLRPFFCRDCRSAVTPVESPLCPRCGIMFQSRVGADHLCGRCLEQAPSFHMARAALVYDRSTVDIIHCYKYRGKTRLAAPLGTFLWRTFVRYWEGRTVDLVLPVPLHRRRLRRRGFNQSELLLREWRMHAHPSVVPPMGTGVLERTRTAAPQAGLGRRERESNIRGVFTVRRPEQVDGRDILLVDDVITTGATAAECARVLLASGAARVDVLALARVI